jgi:flagellar hook-associated protein 1 FlgK
MGSITAALTGAANSLGVLSDTFEVIENNIANANTPGYAAQNVNLQPQPFDPQVGISGGVASGPLISTRSEFLEQAVRNQQQFLGSAQQQAGDLGQIQSLFSLTATTGVAPSLSALFNSFSQLSVSPNDLNNRQAVITAATGLANNIQQTASGIEQVSANVATQTTSVVGQINQIAAQIASINQQYANDPSSQQDAGLDAQMHAALENLSQLANFTLIKNNNGINTVALGGQTMLVIGDQANAISTGDLSSQTTILDAQGNDITSEITQGQLGALIQENNTTIPGYLTGLNSFAQSIADTVNTQLAQGVDQNGDAGVPLFSYDASADAASTIAVNSTLTPDQIAAASAGSPGGNGNALSLAQLATTPGASGYTFTQTYGNLAAQIGTDLQNATANQTLAQNQLSQAETERTAVSGVDLNAEATQLMQYQQAYQAAGKLVTVLEQLSQSVIDMVQVTG